VNASPRLFQRFDDLHRRGWTVRAKPLHNPVRLFAVGLALIAPTGRTSHALMRATIHIKPCLNKVEAVRDAPRTVKNEQDLVVRLPPSGPGQGTATNGLPWPTTPVVDDAAAPPTGQRIVLQRPSRRWWHFTGRPDRREWWWTVLALVAIVGFGLVAAFRLTGWSGERMGIAFGEMVGGNINRPLYTGCCLGWIVLQISISYLSSTDQRP